MSPMEWELACHVSKTRVRLPLGPPNFLKMGKVDKKKRKLQERIDTLQEELRSSLTKKDSSTKEIDVPSHQRKIKELQKELNSL